ncbi:hypothetical protein CCC_00380 [Paramagnetospirillum magnetotacticum MS-1]|uniref:Uncharacterized protein n=1 Tax=Paramagnetospirillum magnetotacticum MS-1 TaxID=272627 RepID=A0A0C2YC39_PARME|nr:hypothetical protein [Paramagnetospirillum magnetotacticum]KIL97319.1 hypothetical protein CCC_00380 [Paramagnetospirillum magnetotacticum MS-1]
MTSARSALFAILALPLWAVGSADSAELSPTARLVPGGGGARAETPVFGLGETQLPLASSGKLSVGTLSGPSAGLSGHPLAFGLPGSPLAVGGYVAYGGASSQLSSSLRSDGLSRGANLAASWGGGVLGNDSRAALALGVSRISPNTQQPSLTLADPYRAGTGTEINMSLSLIHQVSPSFSVGGMAGANRSNGTESSGTGLSLGAGLGYRF